MVGAVVAGYTGIIEQGIEQQHREGRPMTTKQNPYVSMLDEDLDQVSGGLNSDQKATTGYQARSGRATGLTVSVSSNNGDIERPDARIVVWCD